MRKFNVKRALVSALLAAAMLGSLGGCIIYRGHSGYYYRPYYYDYDEWGR